MSTPLPPPQKAPHEDLKTLKTSPHSLSAPQDAPHKDVKHDDLKALFGSPSSHPRPAPQDSPYTKDLPKIDASSIPPLRPPQEHAPYTVLGNNWDSRVSTPGDRKPHPHVHDNLYYLKCMLGGVLSCGLTHTAVVPLDVVKCKMQVFPEKYKGLIPGIRTVLQEEGARGLTLGWLPTLIGYSMQGLFKFGLYEFFKDFYMNLLGEETSKNYKGLIWLAGSASAEFFADLALCPMEMVKVKIQTSRAGTWPTGFAEATRMMVARRADTRFPYGSIGPLWGRQIPYTMAKFYFFEKVVQLFYTHVFTNPKDTYSKPTQLGVTFASGYIAGVICAIVSQAPDNLVSQMGKPENKGKSFGQIAKEVGYSKLFTKGLGTRVLMIGTLTGLQWWIYDSFKSAMGMGTTGGK